MLIRYKSPEVSHRLNDRRPDLIARGGVSSPQERNADAKHYGSADLEFTPVLDFSQPLPDGDGKRIGITGGSGGGTKPFACALDARPIVSFPQGMVSTYAGGCPCENWCRLRVTGNVERMVFGAPPNRQAEPTTDQGDPNEGLSGATAALQNGWRSG